MYRTREERGDAEIALTPYQTIFQRVGMAVGLNRDTMEAFDVNMDRVLDYIKSRRYVRRLPANAKYPAIEYTLSFEDPQFGTPDQLPYNCLNRLKKTYDTPLTAVVVLTYIELDLKGEPVRDKDGNIKRTKKRKEKVNFGRFPVLVGSPTYCITSRTDPVASGEDRHEMGYFVMDGAQRQFIQREIVRFNKVVTYKDNKTQRHICTITCESKWAKTSVFTITTDAGGVVRVSALRGFASNEKTIANLDVMQLMAVMQGIPPQDLDANELVTRILAHVDEDQRPTVFLALGPTVDSYTHGDIYRDLASIRHGSDTGLIDNEAIRTTIAPSLLETLFPHIPAGGNGLPLDGIPPEEHSRIVGQKLSLACVMVARLLTTDLGYRDVDDRNDYHHKRMKRYPESMIHLWNLYWEKNIAKVLSTLDPRTMGADKVATVFQQKDMTVHFAHSNKDKWGLEGEKTRKDSRYIEDYKPEFYMHALFHRHKIVRDRNARSGNMSVRKVKGSQLARVDPAESPETDKVGLNNTRSITLYSSIYRDPSLLESILGQEARGERLEAIGGVPTVDPTDPSTDIFSLNLQPTDEFPDVVLLNTSPHGTCKGPLLERVLRGYRQSGRLAFDTLILYLSGDRILHLGTDSSRPTRPLLTINPETKRLVVDEMIERDGDGFLEALGGDVSGSGAAIVQWLFAGGAIDFLDAMEEVHNVISPSPVIYNRKMGRLAATKRYVEESVKTIDPNAGSVYRSLKLSSALVTREVLDDEYDDLRHQKEETLAVLDAQLAAVVVELQALLAASAMADEGQGPPVDNFSERFATLEGKISLIKGEKRRHNLADLKARLDMSTAITSADHAKVVAEWERAIDDLERSMRCDYCEIDPNAMWGITSMIMPFLPHNPGPRVTFAAKMTKQAQGHHHDAERWRFDKTKSLLYGQRPLTETVAYNMIDMASHAGGFSAIVALMVYHGKSIEDAIVIDKAASERGMGTSIDRKVVREEFHIKHNVQDGAAEVSLVVTNKIPDVIRYRRTKGGVDVYRHLDERGIARVGSRIEVGDCLLGRYEVAHTVGKVPVYTDASIYAKKSKVGTVSKLIYDASPDRARLVMEVVSFKPLEEGDKFATRHAQKGVCGSLEPHWRLPYRQRDGTVPSIFIDPHGFPSRMTEAQQIETIVNSAMALTGGRHNATAWSETIMDDMRDILVANGYSRECTDVLIYPETGEEVEAEIFVGPLYYQKLVQEVDDKIQSRATGLYKATTHQPITGRDNGGAMRYGEQERSALIYHGCSETLKELFMDHSDNFYVTVCSHCQGPQVHYAVPGPDGTIQVPEENAPPGSSGQVAGEALIWCPRCQVGFGDTLRVQIPYVLKMLDNYNLGYFVKTTPTYRVKEQI